jgi:hypothetical protein
VPQSPDLYRRAHNALLSEISAVIPVDAVKSIDELTCRVAPDDRDDPLALAKRIKARLRENIGPYITCSVGPALVLARRLAGLLPEGLTQVFFCDSGSVAVEVAMKMAVQFWLNKGNTQRRLAVEDNALVALSRFPPVPYSRMVFGKNCVWPNSRLIARRLRALRATKVSFRERVADFFQETLCGGGRRRGRGALFCSVANFF